MQEQDNEPQCCLSLLIVCFHFMLFSDDLPSDPEANPKSLQLESSPQSPALQLGARALDHPKSLWRLLPPSLPFHTFHFPVRCQLSLS